MKFLQAIFFLFAFDAVAQTELGIGLASVKFNNETVLKFYSGPYDKEPKQTLEFFNDEMVGTSIKDFEIHEEWLRPEVLAIDYSHLIFRCKSEDRFWVEVVVNNETGETLWLRKSKTLILSTWEEFLKDMFAISRNSMQEIKMQPLDTAEENIYTGEECFQVKSMRGDWIQIFSAEHCEEDGGKLKSGWIKWKEGNTLLVDYFLTS